MSMLHCQWKNVSSMGTRMHSAGTGGTRRLALYARIGAPELPLYTPMIQSITRKTSHLNTIVASATLGESDKVAVLTADQQQISADITLEPGVYAVYDKDDSLQYIGISRKVAVSIQTHVEALGPDMVSSVKVGELPGAGKEELTEAWKAWIESAVEEAGAIPPGNAPGEKMWQQRRRRMAKPEIKLTPGKGVEDLTCSLDDLIDQVVKTNRVVAFVKGTRYEPACGFSYKVLTMLTEISGQDFEVVNVLDEVYNPGLREAIKEYSQWPTIPQVYVGGEFVGGADIIEEMHASGELRECIQKTQQ